MGVRAEENEVTKVAGTLAAWTQKIPKVEEAWKIDGGKMLRLKSGENRAEILQGCGKLKDSHLWLKEDATERERELTQDCLRKEKV